MDQNINKLNSAIECLEVISVSGHEARKRMVMAVELMEQVIRDLVKTPKEGEMNGEVTEAE